MKLYEYQAKELFARVGIPTPRGQVAAGPQAAAEVASNLGRAVVKAQVHAGGRGKAGLIQVVDEPVKAEKAAESMIGRSFKGYAIRRVLVEEALDIQKEYYASVVVDRSAKAPLIMVSAMGGVDIEDVALRSPEAIARLHVDPSHGLWPFQARNLVADAGLDPAHRRAAADIIVRLYRLFLDADASLVEINPLVVLGDGRMLAADAKLEIDDNAVYRHPEVAEYKEEAEEDPLEAEAHRRGLAYVRLDGDVGVIGNGAGLVMNTLDLVARAGGRPANFLDIGGGARSDVVRQALEVVLMDPRVKGVFFNIFGGITRGDEVAKGILQAIAGLEVRVPMVVRMAGTRAREGLELLQGTPLIPVADPNEAARKIVELVRSGRSQ